MRKPLWFQKSLHRLLVDMHIPDWNDEEFLKDFSPENYAEMMALAKVDTAEIYAGSCLGLCFWPSKIGFPHKQLHGRDLLGETMEACRKRNINVQIYLNVWSRAAYDAHPDWRIILYNGKGTCEGPSRFGQCCPNTGYGAYFLALLDELNASYEAPGFWIDMIGNYHFCYCPACQQRFAKETPYRELPRVADWNDPCWLAYIKCRSNWLNEFAENIAATVKKRTPERTITLQTASMQRGRLGGIAEGFLDASDYLAGDFVGDRIEQSCICKYFSMLSKYHPMEFMTPRCENLAHHTTERSFDNLLMRSYAAVANQASFTLIDAIDPRGTLDRRFYEHARLINASYARFEKYISGSSEPVFDIGIYHSPESLIDLDHSPIPVSELEDGWHYPFNQNRRTIIDTLQKNHLLFAFIRGTDTEELKKAPLIILNDCSSLTDAECKTLQEYVREGGRIYASNRTSLYDPDRGIRNDFRLAELFGVHYLGQRSGRVSYIAPAYEGAIPGSTKDYPLMLNSPQLRIRADAGTQIVGTLTLPISQPDEHVRFGSAISNPPMIPTDSPALVRHRFGKGEVMYVAGDLEGVPLSHHCKTFVSLLKALAVNAPLLETNAAPCVECTLFDQPEQRRMVFSCLNLPAELPAVPLYGLFFKIRLPETIKVNALQLAPSDEDYPFTSLGSTLEFSIGQLNDFALFTLHY